MKYLCTLMLTIICVINSPAQESNDSVTNNWEQEVKAVETQFEQIAENDMAPLTFDYKQSKEWKRYKVLRAVGWSSLGLSVPIAIAAGLTGASSYATGNDGTACAILLSASGVLVLSSLGLLISAYIYRHKAKKLSVTLTSINMPMSINTGTAYTPALSFAITF